MSPFVRRSRASGIGLWPKFFATLSAIAPVAAIAQPLDPAITSRALVEYYVVTGTTWREVEASIQQGRLGVPGSWEGLATTYVSLSFPGAASGRCVPAEARVHVDVTIKVPRLVGGARLPPEDQAKWAAYDRSLTDHEEGHMRIAIADAEGLLTKIRLAQGADCARLEAIRREEAGLMAAHQVSYDARTEHGMKQERAYR